MGEVVRAVGVGAGSGAQAGRDLAVGEGVAATGAVSQRGVEAPESLGAQRMTFPAGRVELLQNGAAVSFQKTLPSTFDWSFCGKAGTRVRSAAEWRPGGGGAQGAEEGFSFWVPLSATAATGDPPPRGLQSVSSCL